MWAPEQGKTLEQAEREMRRFIISRMKIALKVDGGDGPPWDLYSGLRAIVGDERYSYYTLKENLDLAAKSILYNRMRWSSSPILFAADEAGHRVSLPYQVLSCPMLVSECLNRSADGLTVRNEGISPELRDFWNIVLTRWRNPSFAIPGIFFEDGWVEAFATDTLFQERSIRRLEDAFSALIDVSSGVVSTERLSKFVMAIDLQIEADRAFADFNDPPRIRRRYKEKLPELRATLEAYKRIEGWRLVVEGDLAPKAQAEIPTQECETPPVSLPAKRGAPKKGAGLVETAVVIEFMKRLEAGDIVPEDTQDYISKLAQDWAAETFGEKDGKMGVTTAKRYLAPVFDALRSH